MHGAPRYLRSDNGPEFVSRACCAGSPSEKIETALIDPGKPWQNGTNESFNGKFRDECLGDAVVQEPNRGEDRDRERGARSTTRCGRTRASADLTPAEFAEQIQSTHETAAIF